MRHFYLYLIKDEFAGHYFGREYKIFRLFQDYYGTSVESPKYQMLKKQIDYVSKKIPLFYLDEFIQTNLKHCNGYSHDLYTHQIQLEKNRGNATLMLNEKNIEISSTGSFDAETTFFEILRKLDPCFFAMDFQNEQYGWLNPIKERKFV